VTLAQVVVVVLAHQVKTSLHQGDFVTPLAVVVQASNLQLLGQPLGTPLEALVLDTTGEVLRTVSVGIRRG